VKGYQYLLPIAPAVAALAARAVAHLGTVRVLADRPRVRRVTVSTAGILLSASLIVPTWSLVNPSTSGRFLAGTGGVPGGREAGEWIRSNVADGSQLFAVGPSMANILQFYGHKRVYGLSVSANPHERNPAYAPVSNPDRWIRDGKVQYLVWDSYSAARTPFFTQNLRDLVDKYRGVAVYTASVNVKLPSGGTSAKPMVIVYQVWAS
jgi:hypothetical protein